MMQSIDNIEFAITIVSALLAGGIIGIERQVKNKNAGLKTNALVAVGAAIFVNISKIYTNMPDIDSSRILSQVIVGVGFLGAGVILHRKGSVSGLATAASIWCSAALGCLAALQLYIPLAISTALIVLINLIFGHWNRKINKKQNGNNNGANDNG